MCGRDTSRRSFVATPRLPLPVLWSTAERCAKRSTARMHADNRRIRSILLSSSVSPRRLPTPTQGLNLGNPGWAKPTKTAQRRVCRGNEFCAKLMEWKRSYLSCILIRVSFFHRSLAHTQAAGAAMEKTSGLYELCLSFDVDRTTSACS